MVQLVIYAFCTKFGFCCGFSLLYYEFILVVSYKTYLHIIIQAKIFRLEFCSLYELQRLEPSTKSFKQDRVFREDSAIR